jgi:excisionase family DNA binding protein
MSTLEDAIGTALTAGIAPLAAELRKLRAEVVALRRALPPQFASVEDAAERLGVSLSTARRRVRVGEWPTRRDGRRVLVDLSALHGMTEDDLANQVHEIRRQLETKDG